MTNLCRHIEVSIYNALLGSINTEGNERINTTPVFDSYSPLRKASRGRATGGLKDIAPDTYYGCCIAIGAAGTALSALSSVGRTEKGFQFNLYYNGIIKTKTPKGNNIEFGINTTYPVGEDIDININLDREEELTLDFRLPFGGKLYVNDNEIDTDTVTRVWKAGDKACIKTNLKIRLLKIPTYRLKLQKKKKDTESFLETHCLQGTSNDLDNFCIPNRQ